MPYAEDATSAALCAVFIHPKNNNSYITVLVVDFKTMSSIKVIGKHSGHEYNILQMDIGTPHNQTPDGMDWQSHLLYVGAKHHPAQDTEVYAAIAPDYRAASFLILITPPY